MVFAGLDIGSRSIELVFWQDGAVRLSLRVPTTFDPLAQCRRLLAGRAWDRLAVTGYGRKLFAQEVPALALTEIQAHARGAWRWFPACRTVLDIGGQDTKAMALGPEGRVRKFEMNDRCAAGTGKFLEFMAQGMGIPLEEFGGFAARGREGVAISSMCTVFAESEATSLMARGVPAEDIARALHQAVAQRALAMLRRVGLEFPLVMTGGVARNPCLLKLLARELGGEVLTPAEPDAAGALGAALYAAEAPIA